MFNKVDDAGPFNSIPTSCNLQEQLVMRQSVFWSTVTVLGYLYKQDNNNTVVAAWNLFDEDGFNLITRLPVTPGDV